MNTSLNIIKSNRVIQPIRYCTTTPLSSFSKVNIVASKAKSIADKLKKSGFLNEKALNLKYEQIQKINPINVIDDDLDLLNKNIKEIIGTQHPALSAIAQYYFDLKGKRIRPVVLLLLARALSYHVKVASGQKDANDEILPSQSKLAEIIEMIHTASLIHDDVIDDADTRRNIKSINIAFGNKVAILAGDFLLARASVALSQLRSFEVTELISRVISDLVEGEFMQLKAVKSKALDFDYYLEKTYYKTASLIANGCRSIAVLANLSKETVESATEFGKNLGLAFQLIDDMLDFVSSKDQLGKPSAQDLKAGIVTAPALYAALEYPELQKIIERNFSNNGDIEKAYELVHNSSGVQKTKELAQEHIQKAIKSLDFVIDSKAKQALLDIAELVITRQK